MTPVAGLYGPDSEAWRLNREAMLLLGAGPRALLLQIAHPLVAAGVDEHSDFRADPWRRLQGTLRSFLRIVYGTGPVARAEIRRLNELHRTIAGRGYTARDPALSLWVHATLVDSTLVANDAWLTPLSPGRRAAYYAETRPIARTFGVPEGLLPRDIDAFDAYVADQIGPNGPVRVGALARELAETILRPPLPGPLGALGVPTRVYDWTLWPAVGLLPPTVRAAYGFPWDARQQVVSRWLVASWRTWRPWLPAAFRQMPQALAADRRMARAAESTAESGAQ